MVVGAFFEPIFTWLTRTLCMLQPYEQLRKGDAAPSRSITADYNSLPPQAIMFRALKSGHLSLASLCCFMTLLANVVSVAFSNLLYESATLLPTPRNFTMAYQFPFNVQGIPNPVAPNKTYDHFYVAMSNLTAGTPLPAWTDQSFFYLPFQGFEGQNMSTSLYSAITPAIGASLDCLQIEQELSGTNLTWRLPVDSIDCDVGLLSTFSSENSSIPEAIEYLMFREHSPICDLTVLAGWGRTSTSPAKKPQAQPQPLDASWIGCQSQVSIELRQVTVDYRGVVQSSTSTNNTVDQLPGSNSSDILDAFHRLLDDSSAPTYPFVRSSTYHNDSYPTDFFNYLMAQTLNTSATLDPRLPPPLFNTTAPLMEALYAQIFAIVLGTHVEAIFQLSNETSAVEGFVLTSEPRIFVSPATFILSMVILGTYILFTVILYVRRPWKILPRMPTTIASQIAFFAASHTLQDFSLTPDMSERVRNSDARGSRQRYGFGRFIGTDGRAHIGIEREPLVQILTKSDLTLMQRNASSV